jgi:glycosyltransferase involved in cell wall biosynthesis
VNVLCNREMSRAINKKLFSNVTQTTDPVFDKCSSTLSQEKTTTSSFFFISNYMYGGCLTFTAHLLHTLNRKKVFRIAKKFEKRKKKNFGYGIRYQNVPVEYLDSVQNIFITDMYEHFEFLEKLRRITKESGKDITIVVHDPGEIFRFNEPYLKYWNIITIRKSMQQYLQDKYGIESKFIYHPFYPYPIRQEGDREDYDDVEGEEKKMQAVSISRIDFYKNIEIILDANKKVKNNPIKIYGWANKEYVSEQLDTVTFNQYYQGKYVKSFDATSKILKKAKFMIDLSFLPNDGGGTQYTFLDAIYHNCAIILNRQWIENVDLEYREFKEGKNCYAISNSEELRELLDSAENIDTTKIVQNARKLLDRHIIKAEEWNKEAMSLQN